MKYDFNKLLLWHSIAYLVFSVQSDLVNRFDFLKAFDWLSDFRGFILLVTTLISFFAFSFFSYTVFYHFYEKKSNISIVLLLVASILPAIGFRYFLQEILQEALFGFGNYTNNYGAVNYILDNLYYALIFTSFGTIFYLIQYSKYKDLLSKELILQNQKTELTLLKMQINPHFLFNTLNNIYTLIYQKSNLSLRAVERLTGLLRYALYEQKEKVLLEKEIKAIEDFIDLQKMRHDFDLALDIEIKREDRALKIAPFLFIPFVENMFKHGNLKNPLRRAKISMFSDKGYFIFRTENEISHRNKDEAGGIGLENIAKRLNLIYGIHHELKIDEHHKSFEATLKIALTEC